MERVFSLDVFLAELIKCSRTPFVRSLFAVSIIGFTLIMALYDASQTEQSLRFPLSLGLAAESIGFIGNLVPPIFAAWIFGNETSADTWKTILVRRPHRLPYLSAKAAAVIAIVALVSAGAAFFQLAVFEVVGFLVGAPRALDKTSQMTAVAVEGILHFGSYSAVACAFAGAAALIARSNGTIIGFVAAYVLQMFGGLLSPDAHGVEAPLVYTHRAVHLSSVWSGVPLPPDATALASFTVAGDLLVIGAWCALPLAIAAAVFCRRDLVSGVG